MRRERSTPLGLGMSFAMASSTLAPSAEQPALEQGDAACAPARRLSTVASVLKITLIQQHEAGRSGESL